MKKIIVINEQIVSADIKTTIDTILDCNNWPLFLPGVKKIQIVEQQGYYTRRILHTEINGILAQMETETYFIPKENKILYKQIKTPWPLICNDGMWLVTPISNTEVKITLSHVFKVKYGVIGYIFGLLIIKPFFIYKHNKKDLLFYKKYIEKKCSILKKALS